MIKITTVQGSSRDARLLPITRVIRASSSILTLRVLTPSSKAAIEYHERTKTETIFCNGHSGHDRHISQLRLESSRYRQRRINARASAFIRRPSFGHKTTWRGGVVRRPVRLSRAERTRAGRRLVVFLVPESSSNSSTSVRTKAGAFRALWLRLMGVIYLHVVITGVRRLVSECVTC